MIEYKGINIEIRKGMYQRSYKEEGSNVYKVEDEEHVMYSVDIHKDYFIEDREEVLERLSNDLIELGNKIKEKMEEKER